MILLQSLFLFSQVKLSLRNDTGTRLDSLTVQGVYVGTIEENSTITVNCDAIELDGHHPKPTLSARYLNNRVEHYKQIECSTFLHTVTKGEYHKSLRLFPNEDGTYFMAAVTIPKKK
jgi:hypothetical protein